MQSITKTVQYSLDQIDTLADILYDMKPSCCVYTFKGEMGSGKTTLIGTLLEKCGITDFSGSPTYTYLYTYKNNIGETFYHFDLYRMSSQADAFTFLDREEYIQTACCQAEPPSWIFIEWPEKITSLLPANTVQIALAQSPESPSTKRSATITYSENL